LARTKSRDLTEAELRLMDVLWKKSSATVAEVAESLPKQLGLAYNTVLTTMRILEDKGYVRHTKAKEGRAFVYHPRVDVRQARLRAVRHLARRLFDGSPSLLVLNVLEDEGIDPVERQRLKRLIEQA